jgi:hypothetical protein
MVVSVVSNHHSIGKEVSELHSDDEHMTTATNSRYF